MRIVDRSCGDVLLEVPDDQGEMLTDLVEDVQSFQVSELFLEVAAREGVDVSIIERLQSELSKSATLFVGSEPVLEEGVALRLSGQLLDHAGRPLGGLVVTAQSKDDDAVAWAFSRPDGSFSLTFASKPDWSATDLLVSGRGGLLLSSFELDELTDEVERMEPFHVITICGRILLEGGQPLAGGRVEGWSTWSVTDGEGRFQIPVDRLGEELHLEVFAPSGQPLGGYWKVVLPETEPVDVGTKVVPMPTPDWPDSEEPLLAADMMSESSMFPGVSEHPLG
jgi:hypothetical protein